MTYRPQYHAFVRDPAGVIVDPLPQATSLSLRPVFNDVGAGTISVPFSGATWSLLQAGAGIVVELDGRPFDAGPIISLRAWVDDEHPPTPDGGGGQIEVSYADDLIHLRDRLCYPDPSLPSTAQTTRREDARAGPLEDVVLGIVRDNASSEALLALRRTVLRVPPSLGRGPQVTWRSRFGGVLAEVQGLLQAAGLGWGVRTVQQDIGGPLLEFAPLRDLSGEVFFSYARRNLTSWELTAAPASATTVIAGGGGDSTSRVVVSRTRAGARWDRRVEVFVDQGDETDAAALGQAADEALTAGADTTEVRVEVRETEQARFGLHYRLGDLVGVRPWDEQLVLVVQGAEVDVDSAGVAVVRPVLGDGRPGARLPRTYRALRDLTRRLETQERRR